MKPLTRKQIVLFNALAIAVGGVPLLLWQLPHTWPTIPSDHLALRPMGLFAQWLAVIVGFGVKPVYMGLSLVLIIWLWRQRARDLAVLRWGLIWFWLGENACTVNFLFFSGECDFWSVAYRDRSRLSAADVRVISEKLNQIGPQIVSIGGGEPMLHPGLAAAVRALARHHFPVMITNGSLVRAECARELWQAGMVEISVSVDYATPEKHDAQRGVSGAFAQALEALRTLHETRIHPEQRVNMISVIMDDNLPDVEPLIRLCRDMGITYLVTLYSHRRGSKPARAALDGVSQRLLGLKKQYRHFVALRGYLERFSEATANGGVGNCSAGRNLWNVDSHATRLGIPKPR